MRILWSYRNNNKPEPTTEHTSETKPSTTESKEPSSTETKVETPTTEKKKQLKQAI